MTFPHPRAVNIIAKADVICQFAIRLALQSYRMRQLAQIGPPAAEYQVFYMGRLSANCPETVAQHKLALSVHAFLTILASWLGHRLSGIFVAVREICLKIAPYKPQTLRHEARASKILYPVLRDPLACGPLEAFCLAS